MCYVCIISTGVDDNMGSCHFDRELRQAMSMGDSFDGTEMFSSDEQFKTDLEPLDLEGLQMIEDPSNVLTDPATEDQLRLCWPGCGREMRVTTRLYLSLSLSLTVVLEEYQVPIESDW